MATIPRRSPASSSQELRRRGPQVAGGGIEASSMDLVETYVAEGFGIGLSVDVTRQAHACTPN